ncbi:MAG: DUF3656 domain-containing protein, partial [Verrucomicrobiae bacterium]|nr:DUF3656 domain-containing protein [Verrucomicrobiae bacterium]
AVSGREGQPLKVSAKCGGVRPVEAHVQSAMPLVRAEKRPLTVETLRDQLGRLGDTPLELGELVAELEGAVIVPISELNRMRRELSEKLESALRQNPSHRFTPQNADRLESGLFAGIKPAAVPSGPAPQLIALCRNPAQMLAALESGVSTVYLDFEDIRQYREAITRARHLHPQARLLVATPRIHKTGENGLFKLMDGCGADGILVRNYGALAFFSEVRRHGTPLELIGDFSLNVTNPLTADWFLQRGLDRLTVSYDLNAEQALALLRQSPADRFEMTLHQHMPMFHMEHCVFAAFLSKGADYRTCGRPCEKHVVHLKDRVGQLHPLKADVGCRNTLFNSAAQTGAEYFEVFAGTGLKRYRVEFVNEGDTEVRQTLDRYQSLLAGKTTGQNLWRDLKAVNQLGVTRGTMTLRSESHVWNSS